jgi:predicted regulator of Ras-like GTPase activity (Roadblock/LC7/MglB family)
MRLLRPLPAHKDAAVIEVASAALRGLTEVATSLRYATVLTDDGFEVVSVPAHAPDGKLSSMSSSVQALSEAVARELVLGAAPYVIIASDAGHLIQLRVPGHELVIAALFGADETLGKALSTSRRAAEKLATALTTR